MIVAFPGLFSYPFFGELHGNFQFTTVQILKNRMTLDRIQKAHYDPQLAIYITLLRAVFGLAG